MQAWGWRSPGHPPSSSSETLSSSSLRHLSRGSLGLAAVSQSFPLGSLVTRSDSCCVSSLQLSLGWLSTPLKPPQTQSPAHPVAAGGRLQGSFLWRLKDGVVWLYKEQGRSRVTEGTVG